MVVLNGATPITMNEWIDKVPPSLMRCIRTGGGQCPGRDHLRRCQPFRKAAFDIP